MRYVTVSCTIYKISDVLTHSSTSTSSVTDVFDRVVQQSGRNGIFVYDTDVDQNLRGCQRVDDIGFPCGAELIVVSLSRDFIRLFDKRRLVLVCQLFPFLDQLSRFLVRLL